MAGNDDLASQLSIQHQINKVLQQRQQMMLDQAKSLGSQAKLAAELCKALQCKDLEGLEGRIKGINDTLSQAANNAEKAGQSMGGMADSTEKASEKADDLASKIQKFAVSIGLVKGLQQAFSGTVKTMTGFGKGVMNIVGSVWKLSMAILSIPLKIYEGLIGMAQAGGGGPDPVKVQLEEIRKQFGSLANNEGKAFIKMSAKLQSNWKKLDKRGVSLSRLFGHSRGGLAAALKQLQEIATEVGPVFSHMYDSFEKNAEVMLRFQKGLGFSNKAMGAIIKTAHRMGTELYGDTGVFTEMTKSAKQFAADNKMNEKGLTKTMGDLIESDARYARQTSKKSLPALQATAMMVKKLGIEVGELKGMVDKWENWDDAIESSGQLAAAFGVVLDVQKMSIAPMAEKLEMQKEATKQAVASGKLDLENAMQMKNYASILGISEDAVLALAKARKGDDLASVIKTQEKAGKKTMTQTEAMIHLADSMERVFGSGGGSKFKGFIDAFIQGFGKGIKRSHSFRKVLRNIRKSLKIVYRSGIEVGKMFVKLFPGVEKMFKGLQGLFDPKKFTIMMGQVKGVFRQFFLDVRTDPKAGLETFVKKMREVFKKFFGKQGSAAKDVSEGGQVFLKTLWGIFKAALFMVVPMITKGLKQIADLIRNPPEINSAFGEMMMGMWSELKSVFGAMSSILGPPLLEAFMVLFDTLGEKIKPYFEKVFKYGMGILLAKALFIMFVSVAKSALVGKGIVFLFKKLAGLMNINMPPAPERTPAQIREAAEARIAPFQGTINGLNKLTGIKEAADMLKELTFKFLPAFALFLTGLMLSLLPVLFAIQVFGVKKLAVAIGGTAGLIFAFVALFKATKTTTSGDIGTAAGVLRTMAWKFVILGFVPFVASLALVAAALSVMPISVVLSMIPVFLGMALIAAAMGGLALVLGKIDSGGMDDGVARLRQMVPMMVPLGAFALGLGALAVGLAAAGVTTSMALTAAATMLGVVGVLYAMTFVAKAASRLTPGIAGDAVIGIGLAAGLAYITGGLFALSILAMDASKIFDIDWKRAGVAFGVIAQMMGTIILVSAAGALLALALGGAQGALVLAGIVAAGVLIAALGWGFAMATSSFAENLKPKAVLKTAIGLAAIAIIMAELLVVALVAAVGIVPFALGVLGIGAAALFVLAMTESGLLTNLMKVGKESDGLALQKGNFEGLTIAMDALMKVADASDRLNNGFMGFSWMRDPNRIIDPVKDFLKALTDGGFLAALVSMASSTSANPDSFKKNAEAIGLAIDPIVKMIQASAALGAIEDGVISNTTSPETFAGIKSVVDAIIGGVGPIIKDLLAATKSLGNIDTAKVQAMASMIGGLAEMFGALAGPLASIAESAAKSSPGQYRNPNKITDFTTGITGLLTGIISAIKDEAGPMISSLLTMEIPGLNLAGAKEKVGVMVDAMKVIGALSSALSANVDIIIKMQVAETKAKHWWEDAPLLNSMITSLGRLMDVLMPKLQKHLPGIISALMESLPAGSGADLKTRMEAVLLAVKGISDATALVPKMLSVMPATDPDEFEELQEKITVYFGTPEKEGLVVQMIVPLAKSVGASLASILSATSDISASEIKSLKPRMDIVASAMAGIAEMANIVASLLGMSSDPAPGVGGTAEELKKIAETALAEDIVAKARKVKSAIEIILAAFADPNTGITSVIGEVIKLTNHPDIKRAGAGANIDIVAKALGIAGTFVKTIKDVTSLSDTKGYNAEELYNAMTWLGRDGEDSVIGMVAKAIATHLPVVVNAIAGIVIPASMDKSKIEIITSALQGVTSFTSAISSISKAFGAAGGKGKPLNAQEAKVFLTTMFGDGSDEGNKTSPMARVASAISTHMPPIVNSIAEIKIGGSGFASRIKNVVAALNAVVKFSEAMSLISRSFPEAKLPGGVDPVLAQTVAETTFPALKDTVEAVKDTLPDLVGCMIDLVTTGGGSKIGSHIGKIITLGKIFPVISKFATAMADIKSVNIDGGSISDTLTEMSTAISGVGGGGLPDLITHLVNTDFQVAGLKVASTGLYWFNRAMVRLANALVKSGAVGLAGAFAGLKASMDDFSGIPGVLVSSLEDDGYAKGGGIVGRIKIFDEALKALDASFNVENLGNSAIIDGIMHNIMTMSGMLSTTDFTQAGDVVAAFSKGTLQVYHNLPDAKVHVTVNLSAKKLAEAVVNEKVTGGYIRPTA